MSKRSKSDAAKNATAAAQLQNEGASKKETCETLNVSRVTLWRYLKNQTIDFVQRQQPIVDELKKRGAIEIARKMDEVERGLIEPDAANAWSRLMGDLTKLMGLNEPDRRITATINAEVDPQTLGRYRKFCHKTRFMNDTQLEPVYALCDKLNVPPPHGPMTLTAPESPEMWGEDWVEGAPHDFS